jgi:hypothetical protein
MAKLPTQTRNLIDSLSAVSEATLIPQYMTPTTATGTPAAGEFYSEIFGRAPLLDLSQVPSGKHGVERIYHGNTVEKATGEVGPNGEIVYKTNDLYDRIRFYAEVIYLSDNDQGKYVNVDSGYAEITFYGTGLNILAADSGVAARDARAAVNGGTEGSNFMPSGTLSAPYPNRKYDQNVVINVVSGLALGIHTVRLRGNTYLRMHGLEILNETVDVQIPGGSIVADGQRYDITAGTDDLTTFENEYQDGGTSIIDATKGGHMVRYIDTDGTIKKDINYADSSQQNLTSADHSNEEEVQRLGWRQFGAGRSDDFSTLDSALDDCSFTLDDGTTALVGNDVNTNGAQLIPNANGAFITLTFVGTGLDMIQRDSGVVSLDPHEFFVDGISIGTVSTLTDNNDYVRTIVSGLPFGTHTVKIQRNAFANSALLISSFIIYGPKKPAIPTGAVEIDSTYKMADFVANTTVDDSALATGVLRKHIYAREAVYIGPSWVTGIDMLRTGGEAYSNNPSDSFEYTFFGTGFDLRFAGGANKSANITVQIDGANYTGAGTTVGTGITWTPGSSTLDQKDGSNVYGAGFKVEGLTLDTHTVRFTLNDSDFLVASVIDIIAPTYNYSNNVLNTSDALVGSNTLKNELLIPGATKTKIIATEGIDLGPNKNRWQKKNLSSSTSSTGVLPGLTFNNLVIGKTYQVSLHMFATTTDPTAGETAIKIQDTGSLDELIVLWRDQSTGSNYRYNGVGSYTWTAATTVVNFNMTDNQNSSLSFFTTSYAILTELNNYEPETSAFT